MTMIDDRGQRITDEELAASYAADLRDYAGLSREAIDARLWKMYPGVMRRWAIQDKERSRGL